jgi:hypothetical protein
MRFCCYRVREVPLEADDAAAFGAAPLGRGQMRPGEGAPLSPPLHLLAFSLATGADSAAAAAALPPQFEARTMSMDDIGEDPNPESVHMNPLMQAPHTVPAQGRGL